MDWAAGLLGGVAGVGTAVDQVAAERRRILAEHLKLQALEDIEKRADTRRHGYAKELQGERIGHEERQTEKTLGSHEKVAELGRTSAEKISEAGIKSHEKIASEQNVSAAAIASERNAMLKEIADMENSMKERILGEDLKGRKAAEMKAKVMAYTEARKVLEGGGSTDEANAVLDAADLPTFEEYIKEPATEGGLFGWGAKPAVKGRRLQGTGAKAEETTAKPTDQGGAVTPGAKGTTPGEPTSDVGADIKALLEAGRGTGPVATEKKQAGIIPTPREAGAATPEQPAPAARGLIPKRPDLTAETGKPEIMTIEGMQVKAVGGTYEVYDKASKVWRKPTREEKLKIREAMEPKGYGINIGIRQEEREPEKIQW
jgi:preprotein translocase subunit Sss1